jgi:hypothetical protein
VKAVEISGKKGEKLNEIETISKNKNMEDICKCIYEFKLLT